MYFRLSALLVASTFVVLPSFAQKKADKKVINQLKEDIGYLASDELEGRRTGTEGEKKAAAYIIGRYKTLGIPAYKGEYSTGFNFSDGKEIGGTTLIKIGKERLANKEGFPLPFSANKRAYSEVLPDVLEQGNIWLLPLYADKDEANDAHFDWEKAAYDKAEEAIKQGATGVVFYDSYDAKYPPEFNAKSEYDALDIPVAYMAYNPYQTVTNETRTSGIPVELNVSVKKSERSGNNVAAFINNNATYTVVIGAHYDHLGHGEDGNSMFAKKDGQVHNGADDNASGTAGLLQLAEWPKKSKLKKYNYVFAHFSGEELGLIGSKAFVKAHSLDSSKIAYMINMDMIGRLNDSTHALTVGGIGTSPVWPEVASKDNKQFRIAYDSSGVGPSDHSSFYYANIPVLFVFTGLHTDYHKPSDDADKVNYLGETQVLHYVYSIIDKMDKKPKPAFTTTKQTTVGKVRFKVTLGIMPDYSYQDGGVRVDGVTEGKPAIRAGIKGGDVITQLGEHKINGMQTYMEALSKFTEGEKTEVKLKRDGKEITLPIEFNKP